MITCRICKKDKPQEEFYRERRNKSGYMSACKLCELDRKKTNNIKHKSADPVGWSKKQAEYAARYKAKYPERVKEQGRAQGIRRKYGLTVGQYDALLVYQQGKCAGCGTTEKNKRFAVDHDHSCCPGQITCGKCVRGLLCHNCNTALGLLKENAYTMRRLIRYLGKEYD